MSFFGIVLSAKLTVVTDDEKLILMTSTWDVLSEAPIEKTEFGTEASINIGWGSKQTQFHGSLGKAAAATTLKEQALDGIGSSSDDDGLPHISWLASGASFAVSSLSPASPLKRRVIRIYDRDASLQSTSTAVAGLEHPLAWKPSGEIIASSQRFASAENTGMGRGRDFRHDVVFFERNGLRHGEFGLKIGGSSVECHPAKWPRDRMYPWGYKLKALMWNSDSSVLSTWIEMEDSDVGKHSSTTL